jgi:hypothetical protein
MRNRPRVWLVVLIVLIVIAMLALHLSGAVGPGSG